MLWHLRRGRLAWIWLVLDWPGFTVSNRHGRRGVLVAVGCLFALAACDAPGDSIVLERFPVEVTLNIVAEGQQQTATRILQCRKVLSFSRVCTKCTYWGTATQRMVQPLPSGGSLLLNIRENFCRDLVEDGFVPKFDESSQALLAWVDDIDTPTVVERYDIGNQSISDKMAVAAKIQVASFDLKFKRLGSVPEGITDDDRERILWFGRGGNPPRRGQRVAYQWTTAHVIRQSEWVWDPGMGASLLEIRWQTRIRGELEERIRRFSRDWTSNHPALIAKNPIFKRKPIMVPFRRDADGVWEIDHSKTGIYVLELIGSGEDIKRDFASMIRINAIEYQGDPLVVYVPSEGTVYVVSKGQSNIY